MNCYKDDLIAARRTEGALFLALGLAFVAFALDNLADDKWWLVTLDLAFTAVATVCAVSCFRDASHLRKDH